MMTQKANQAQELIDRHIVRLQGRRPNDSDYAQFKQRLDNITMGDSIMYETCVMQWCSRSGYLS